MLLALLASIAQAQWVTDFSDDFSSYPNTNPIHGTGSWTSTIPGLDPWRTTGGRVGPRTDGCNNGDGVGFGTNSLDNNMLVRSGLAWDDSRLSVSLRQADNDTIGAVFRWTDSCNYYLVYFNKDGGPTLPTGDCAGGAATGGFLIRVQACVGTQLASTTANWTTNAWHRLSITAVGADISVDWDGSTVMNITDPLPLTSGSVGLEVMTSANALFDDVLVEIPDTDLDTVADRDDNCPNDANTNQANLDGDALGDACDGDVDGDGVLAAADCDDRDNTVGEQFEAFQDGDGDGFGNAAVSQKVCAYDSQWVADDTDCLDTDGSVNTDGTELCNDGLDNDCSGAQNDGAVDAPTWYADTDSDGFGDASVTDVQCVQPTGYVSDDTDCDDGQATDFPGADEVCDGRDNDCQGDVDEADATDAGTWYDDSDSDGFGNAAAVTISCVQPGGTVTDATDCDDGQATDFPGADEVCDGRDNDCQGDIDEADAIDVSTWYDDADSDGYGDPAVSVVACDPPFGHVSNADDCDDTRSTVSPDDPEICDGRDNDCDGTVDGSDALDANVYYADTDNDGYGDIADAVFACAEPEGYVDDNTDCNDQSALVRPGAPEQCNGVDDDCDNAIDDGVLYTDWYPDNDQDGFGEQGSSATNDCVAPPAHSDNNTDCDDTSNQVWPGNPEVCDGLDNDCNGVPDDLDCTGDTGDTGLSDTGDTVDTGITDTADTADGPDTGDGEPPVSASNGRTVEAGSPLLEDQVVTGASACGCTNSPGSGWSWAVALLLATTGLRRRRR